MFKSLAKDEGVWRVDGIGELNFYENSVPRAKIILSQIKREGMHSSLKAGQSTGKQKIITEPLNRIDEALVGSCWEAGRRVSKLGPFEGRRFLVDTSKIQFYRPGDSISLDGREFPNAVPFSAIRFGNHFKYLSKTWFALVPVLKDPLTEYLVIPCSELYRFYIGVSDRFSNAVVRNTAEDYVEWKGPALRVKQRLSRLEMFVAYRGFCSREGLNWFHMPSEHIRTSALHNNVCREHDKRPLTIKSTFPFEGETTLTVGGKAFAYRNDAGQQCWAVFAANLFKCSHPEYFEPLIESDTFADDGGHGIYDAGEDVGESDNDFDEEEEEFSEEDIPPNGNTRGVVRLNESNRFDAMIGLQFPHVHPLTAEDPLYPNDNESPHELGSYEDASNDAENEGVGAIRDFESQVDVVGRKLSSFIDMVIQLRNLVKAKGWEVTTKSCRSVLEVNGEVVTTFLHTKNKRRRWHLMPESDGVSRLRQVVWVEIELTADCFIYLVEMEVKNSESPSTLLIVPKSNQCMSEKDFEILLNMTAVKNRWPRRTHTWEGSGARKKALRYFDAYKHDYLTHPSFEVVDGEIGKDAISNWAKGILSKLSEVLGLEGNEKS